MYFANGLNKLKKYIFIKKKLIIIVSSLLTLPILTSCMETNTDSLYYDSYRYNDRNYYRSTWYDNNRCSYRYNDCYRRNDHKQHNHKRYPNNYKYVQDVYKKQIASSSALMVSPSMTNTSSQINKRGSSMRKPPTGFIAVPPTARMTRGSMARTNMARPAFSIPN